MGVDHLKILCLWAFGVAVLVFLYFTFRAIHNTIVSKIPSISRFSFPEMFNDNNGKTQAVLVCGVAGFFTGVLGMVFSVLIPAFMPSMKFEKVAELIILFKDSRGDFLILSTSSYLGISAHVFSKDKPLNTAETAGLPKPVQTVSEMHMPGVNMKETTTEYKAPDAV